MRQKPARRSFVGGVRSIVAVGAQSAGLYTTDTRSTVDAGDMLEAIAALPQLVDATTYCKSEMCPSICSSTRQVSEQVEGASFLLYNTF